jgi:hypothetical protein
MADSRALSAAGLEHLDLWVARYLLSQGKPAPQIQTILRLASPYFPRHHGDPDGYLRRTVAGATFPSPGRAVCDDHTRASAPLHSELDSKLPELAMP